MHDKSTYMDLEKQIAELKQAESENTKKVSMLIEENRILEGVFNGIPDIIAIQKPDHTVIRYNRAGYNVLKKNAQEVKDLPCFTVIGRKTPCKDCATRLALKSKRLEVVEKFVPELNRYFICRSHPVLDESGEVSHIIEQLQDITLRRILEKEKDHLIEQLQAAIVDLRSRVLYKMLAEKIKEGVVIGHHERIVYANPSAQRILKRDEESLHSIGLRDIIHESHKKVYDTILARFRRDETLEDIELCCFDTADGKIWIQADCMPIEWQGDRGVMVTFMDITDMREKRRVEREESLRLRKENRLLKSKNMHSYGLAHLVGTGEKMQTVYDRIICAATAEENAIIYGESGTGKELVAKSIHDLSGRSSGPFIAVNCGAIPENLVESEFFGHKKGAFSGANMDKLGFFESAHKGTLFLDEIGEIPLNLQVKLLRAIEGYGFSPVGSTEVKKSDVRIIAATNRDLKAMVEAGKVREDFFFRIHIIPIRLPPLRERKEDIPLLVYHFTRKLDASGRKVHISDDVIKKLLEHDWPGNVRELQNAISRYLAFDQVEFSETSFERSKGTADDDDTPVPMNQDLNSMLKVFERQIIQNALTNARENKSLAAKILGIDRRSLHRKISRLGL